MAYQVLARKYRPQSFQEVIGQEPVIRALTNALESGRTAHAYLFSGIRGVGKTTTARLLAKALNCDKGPTPGPCNECPACLEVAVGNALDVIEIDAATYTKLEHMREVLERTRYSPARDRYKVYIIDEIHMLSAKAFNALLKTLEEPPAHVVFILATTEPRKVPATIVSRCQHFEFRPVPHPEIVRHLGELCAREGADVAAGAISLIARRAAGSVRDGQSLLDLVLCYGGEKVGEADAAQVLGVADSRALSGLLQAVGESDPAAVLARLDALLEAGADPVQIHQGLVEHVRNLLVVRVLKEPSSFLAAGAEEVAEWREVAAPFGEVELLRLLRLLARGEQEVRYASQPRYLLEGLLVRCCFLDRLKDLEEVLRGLDGAPADTTRGGKTGGGDKGGGARKEAAPSPGKQSAGCASTAARLAGVVERASLKQWLRQTSARVEGPRLVLEVPEGRAHLADQLRTKGMRDAILRAARSAFGDEIRELVVAQGEAGVAEPAPEPPAPATEARGKDRLAGGLLDDAPALRTLVDIFEGEIEEGASGPRRESPDVNPDHSPHEQPGSRGG